MLTSYHNHSFWSDGRASVINLLHEARRLGVDELGVSDHLVLDPHGQVPGWSMRPDLLPRYLADLNAVRRSQTPLLRIGIELDWLPGQRDAIAKALDDDRFDYAIGSVHQVAGLHVDTASDALARMGQGALEVLHERYWRLMKDMARSGLYDIAGHLDLPKKLFGRPSAAEERADRAHGFSATRRRKVLPSIGGAQGVDEALDAIAEAGMVVELNTAGWSMPCAECYPSPTLLRACRIRDIPVTINADAHSAQHLLRHFGRAVRLLREVGYHQVAHFEGRRIQLQPLDDFESRLAVG